MIEVMGKRAFLNAVMVAVLLLFISENAGSANGQGGLAEERNYNLAEGFRSLKWGAQLADAKKIYPDLLFVEQIPRTDPKYLYYRRKNENKTFSGLEWDRIMYVFTKSKDFVSADAETRFELEDKDKAIAQYNDLYQKITAKYGKPFHAEKTDEKGYPFLYSGIWHIGSESVSLDLGSINDNKIYKDSGVESEISMLEFKLGMYSDKGEGKALDF
jgi:hypothetical protein